MKKFILPVLGVWLACSASAQVTNTNAVVKPVVTQPVVAQNNPADQATQANLPDEKLLTLKETEFNFGKIPQGKPVTHIFYVDNKSTDSLKILNVQASC